jgi:polysaccharide deacetylase 2 family uncharacterized protein YibQ
MAAKLSRQFLAALRAAASQNLTATGSSHARAKTVAALAYQFAGLIGTFHISFP